MREPHTYMVHLGQVALKRVVQPIFKENKVLDLHVESAYEWSKRTLKQDLPENTFRAEMPVQSFLPSSMK